MNAIRIVTSSLVAALACPRVWLTIWFVVAVAAAATVYPFEQIVDDKLAHHPGASYLVDQSLDADLARAEAAAVPDTTNAMLLSLLVMTFLGGGILATVGTAKRFSYTGFLANSAYYFTRSVRALVLCIVPLVAMSWGSNALLDWLRHDVLRNENAGGPWWMPQWLNLELGLFALTLCLGVLFYVVMFTYKVTRAILVLHDRRSVLLAWGQAIGKVVRHPLQVGVIVVGFLALSFGGATALGELTGWLLEERGELLLGAAAGQASMMWLAIVTVAQLIAARKFVASAKQIEDRVEPVVIIPHPIIEIVPSSRSRAAVPQTSGGARRS